jgi:hypothetical protein
MGKRDKTILPCGKRAVEMLRDSINFKYQECPHLLTWHSLIGEIR